jgi:hypothetical protein
LIYVPPQEAIKGGYVEKNLIYAFSPYPTFFNFYLEQPNKVIKKRALRHLVRKLQLLYTVVEKTKFMSPVVVVSENGVGYHSGIFCITRSALAVFLTSQLHFILSIPVSG